MIAASDLTYWAGCGVIGGVSSMFFGFALPVPKNIWLALAVGFAVIILWIILIGLFIAPSLGLLFGTMNSFIDWSR